MMFQNFVLRLLLLATLGTLAGCDARLPKPGPEGRTAARNEGARAQPSRPRTESCSDHYLDGAAPRILNAKLARATTALCFREFSVMHSGVTRTPLWASEHLEDHDVAASAEVGRKSAFHAERRLPPGERAELEDYKNSGYDRGHLVPSDDMSNLESQRDSFSLANMVPQQTDMNRRQWAAIERAVRNMAKREGELYVVTGPAFLGSDLRKVGNVLVPTHLYKLVWSPQRRAGAAWFVENTADAKPTVLPIPELERIIGIDLLPAVGSADKERMLPLPAISTGKKKQRS